MYKAKPLTLYRVIDEACPTGLIVKVKKYAVVGETERCFYVIAEDSVRYACKPNDEAWIKRNRRRVLKCQGGRRFCYLDLQDALKSYQRRKEWQLKHARLAVAKASAGNKVLKKLLENPALLTPELGLVEPSKYIAGLHWGDCSMEDFNY